MDGIITKQMKREFWKHNLNPITGLPKIKRLAASVGIAEMKILKITKTRYSN